MARMNAFVKAVFVNEGPYGRFCNVRMVDADTGSVATMLCDDIGLAQAAQARIEALPVLFEVREKREDTGEGTRYKTSLHVLAIDGDVAARRPFGQAAGDAGLASDRPVGVPS